MDRILALVILLFTAPVFAASSTVVYPRFSGLGTTVVSGQTVKAATSGAVFNTTHNVFSFSGAAGSRAVLPSMAEAVGTAITLRAPVIQSAAKIIGSNALRTLATGSVIGVLGLWALDRGMQYVAGQWQTTEPDPNTPPGYGWQPSIGYYGYPDARLSHSDWQVRDIAKNECWARGTPPGQTTWDTIVTSPDGTTFYCASARNFLQGTVQRPATQQDFDDLAANGRDLTNSELQGMADNGIPVPVAQPTTVIGDFSNLSSQELADLAAMGFFQPLPGVGAVPVGDPVTDPVTGQKTQPMVQLESAPNAGVRLTPYEMPLDANGNPATDTQGNPLPAQERQADPCELDPSRAGCATLGELNDETPQPDVTNVSITPQTNWGGSGQCPSTANLSFLGQPIAFEFTPACTFFSAMQPVVIAAAWVASILIFIGGVKGQAA